MKNIGLYFGSFNPIHIGHLILAEWMISHATIDELWIVVSPQNPLKPAADLAPEIDRLEMVRLATNDNPRIKVSDVEFNLEKPSYTANTLAHLKSKFPNDSFTVILGEDVKTNFHLWKNYSWILENFPIRLYPRHGVEISSSPIDWGAYNVQVVNAPRVEVSSTQIRKNFLQKIENRYLVPENVLEYISKNKIYSA